MLEQLVISDLAVIHHIEVEFEYGMTVFTGETGAGKSILLDAIGLILGDRADTNLIRGDAEKADITGIFSITDLPNVKSLLQQMDIDTEDDKLFIRRVINTDGRSKAYLNHSPVPIQILRDVGEHLIDIFGQHAHQSLSKPQLQRQLLDDNGDYQKKLDTIREIHQEFKLLKNEIAGIETGGENYDARLTLLRYQVDELQEFNITENEFEELSTSFKKLNSSQQLIETCSNALAELSDNDDAISDRISHHLRQLEHLQSIEPTLGNTIELMNNANIQINEAIIELSEHIKSIDTDQESIRKIEKRMERYHELARKHHVKPEILFQHQMSIQEELNKLEHGQEHHEKLQTRIEEIKKHYFAESKTLHNERVTLAKKLSAAVTEKMHELGIGGDFSIDVSSIDDETLREHGMDKIQFLVSTNPGQPLRPLNKVASGGELSRLSLAIQIIAINSHQIPTLIFDEVDTGISGGIAEVVGKMLHKLAAQRQVFCVTHLAQVASCGQQHYRVSKEPCDGLTFTKVESLDRNSRIDEVARMLAGLEITNESRANAEKMLNTV